MQERDKEHRNVVCSRLQNFLPPQHAAGYTNVNQQNVSGFGVQEDIEDSGKSSKQSSRKSSSVLAPQGM